MRQRHHVAVVAVSPTTQLLDALRNHYIKPGDTQPGAVFLTEVTAPNRSNRADAIHVGLWASRGYTVDVHELKVSRTDFQRELDNPAKAEAWWAHSNTFWIVAPHESITPPELLPAGWGLMVPGTRGRRFKKVVEAEHRDLRPSTALLAALLVSMETDQNNALQQVRREFNLKRELEIDKLRREGALNRDPKTRERLERLDELESLIGFKLSDFDYGTNTTPAVLAHAIREAVAGERTVRDIDRALVSLESEAKRLMSDAAAIRKSLAEQSALEAVSA